MDNSLETAKNLLRVISKWFALGLLAFFLLSLVTWVAWDLFAVEEGAKPIDLPGSIGLSLFVVLFSGILAVVFYRSE